MGCAKETAISFPRVLEVVDGMGTTYDLTWQEISPGVHERDVDEAEMFYSSLAKTYEGTGRTYNTITAYLGFSVPFSVQTPTIQTEQSVEIALRKAWKRLRYDHPTLAAPVRYDSSIKWCRKVYKICEDNGEEWLEETFKLVNGQSGHDFANEDPTVGRYATLYFINPPLEANQLAQNFLRRDIVFRCTHDLIDGIGTLTLLDNLMRHAAQAYAMQDSYPEPIFGDEQKNLSPPFRSAAHLPNLPTPQQWKRFEARQASNQSVRLANKALTLPITSYTSKPWRCRRVAIPLTATHTIAIMKKCSDLGVTPTHIIHAAIALSVRDLQEKSNKATEAAYISYVPVSLRSACMTPFNTPLHAAAVYHSMSAQSLFVPLKISSSIDNTEHKIPEEFLGVLKTVNSFYRTIKVDADYLSTALNLFVGKSPPYPLPRSSPATIPAHVAPMVSLSNMGVVDKIIRPLNGDFTITSEPWVIAAEYSPGIGVFLETWKGVMEISAAYNEAFRTEEEVRRFLSRVKEVVLQGLSVVS